MPRSKDQTRPLRRSGFTIVEAVVLISVIGVLGAVAAPRFLSVSDLDLATAHREAVASLRFAQQRAMSSGCPVQVDFEGTQYTVSRRTACRTGAFALDVPDPTTGETPYTIELPASASITSSVDPLVFDAMGRATTGAGVVSDATISLGGLSIEAIGETGLVRVP